jgi:hypothetical protein
MTGANFSNIMGANPAIISAIKDAMMFISIPNPSLHFIQDADAAIML